LLSFIAASTGAYFVAVWLSVLSVLSFRPSGLSRDEAFYAGMFVGGLVGGFLILTTAQLLLSLRRKWKAIFGRAVLWSLAGGALGLAGFALGGSLGKLLWLALHAMHLTMTDADLERAVSTETVNVFSLFVLWQTCMAPLLGWLVAKGSAAQPEHQSA